MPHFAAQLRGGSWTQTLPRCATDECQYEAQALCYQTVFKAIARFFSSIEPWQAAQQLMKSESCGLVAEAIGLAHTRAADQGFIPGINPALTAW